MPFIRLLCLWRIARLITTSSLLADREGRVVVTKDSDFVTSFLLHGVPSRLLLISTGNIANDALLDLFRRNLRGLESILSKHSFVELNRFSLTVHL
jgi:predicted nuclease of predicted toxin-antitoxin system